MRIRGQLTRIIPPKRYEERVYVDPNSPGSPDYSERHREKVTEIMPGMLLIEIGSHGD